MRNRNNTQRRGAATPTPQRSAATPPTRAPHNETVTTQATMDGGLAETLVGAMLGEAATASAT